MQVARRVTCRAGRVGTKSQAINSQARRSLTPRQAQIAALLARGASTRDIAQALYLSPRTVDVHIAAIREKWKLRSRLELATKLLAGDAGLGEETVGPTPETNLPPSRAGLMGREAAITDLVGALRRTDLVAVTRAGAVGKTRVALAVGEAVVEHAQAEVWIVEFAPIARVGPVPSPAAEASHLQESPSRPLIETLVGGLKQKSLVLIVEITKT